MCLHFGLVATSVMDNTSLAKHFVFMSVGQDQKFSLSSSTKMGCLKVVEGISYKLHYRANSFVTQKRIKCLSLKLLSLWKIYSSFRLL